MNWTGSDEWLTRLVFQRALAVVFFIAFLNTANQFKPLLGERGLLPVGSYVKDSTFSEIPSLFVFFPNDVAFTAAAWTGVAISSLAVVGLTEQFGMAVSMIVWTLLWALYMSFVNVGQTFYGFGWESILLEAGFYAIFLGSSNVQVSTIALWLERWLLFRLMFGAGLIKLRGDDCWRDLTCLNYHYETQPMPNPLSWFFHWGPQWTKSGGVLFNHLAELIVPFFYFLPQPIATIAGLITILFQLTIFASGNLSWLNFLTMVIALTTVDGAWLAKIVPLRAPPLHAAPYAFRIAAYGLAAFIAYLSIKPIENMISPRQIMNTIYNRYHLVGTYGAFGSITRPRYEVVVEGTDETVITASTRWREYEFKGKPNALDRLPAQIAPYHLRLDWLMWFAALSSYYQHPWFANFLAKLLENDQPVLSLLRSNPFPDQPPRYVRASLYEYHFTTPAEHARSRRWWNREFVRPYFPAVSLSDARFQSMLEHSH